MRTFLQFFITFILSVTFVSGTEKTDADYPLGKIGGKYFAQIGANSIRVSELTAGGPGELAGLQVNDFIYGAFGEEFEDAIYDTWGIFIGPTKGLGEAIEKAQRADGVLPLMIIRAGVGQMVVNVQLDADGGLGPTFPLGSTAYASQYEIACDAIHESISNNGQSGVTGSGYPYRWAGFALLGHPDWNSTTGDNPYRISIDIVRDACLSKLENALYVPQEQRLPDGSSNPNFVNNFAGHENWQLNTSLMFLAEYVQKTKEVEYYDELQTYSEKIANRIQWWKQYGGAPIAGGAHAGVHSDYTAQGFNICVVHSLSALAMAKKVTDVNGDKVVDLTVRIRDGRHYGYASEDDKPDSAKNVVPDGWDESVDPSIAEKMGWQWDQLVASMDAEHGQVSYTYDRNESFSLDSSARTAGAAFGYMTYLEGATPTAENQAHVDLMTDYMVRYQEHFQYAHTHTISGVGFHMLSMPYWTSQQRRYLLDQWKFYWHLAWQPNGAAQEYFTGWEENDNDSNYLLGEIFTALPYSVARGGYDLIPGWATDELVIDFHNTPFKWYEPEYRSLVADGGEVVMNLSLSDSAGNAVAAPTVAWTVESANAANVSISNSADLSPTIQFSQDGLYELKLVVQADGKSLTEKLKVHVHQQTAPAGYVAGKVVAELHGGFNGSPVTAMSGTPSREMEFHSLDFPEIADTMGREVDFYIIPRETGNYQFYVASSDVAELHQDFDGDNVWETLATSSVSVDRYDWQAAAEQESVVMSLTAGELYHLRLFEKTGKTPGYASVGWKTPSNSTIEVINSSVLAIEEEAEETPAITYDLSSYERGIGSVMNFFIIVSGEGPKVYQWYRNGEKIGDPRTGETSSSSRQLFWPVNGGSHGEYYCECTVGNTVLTSNVVTLTVTNNTGSLAGGVWVDIFDEIEGNTVADLEADYTFPWLPEGGYTTVSSFYYKTSSQNTNYIGHRASAWVVPTESGNYKFFVSADDNADLYLSPTEYDAHMVKIAATTGATGERTWSSSKAGESEYFALEAGKRYYIELRHKEKQGASYFGVAWQKEGDPEPVNGEGEIPSANLEYRAGGYHSHGVIPAPVLFDDDLNVLVNTPKLIDVTQNDAFVGSIEVTSVSTPANGYLRVSSDKKSIVYTYSGAGGGEDISYTAQQEDGQSATATLSTAEMTSVSSGQVAYWSMDEVETDQTITDESGNGYNLSITGDPSISSTAVKGSALSMLNDKLSIPVGLQSQLSDEITISLWAKRDSGQSLTETTMFHAKDASGNKLLEINIPRYNASVWFELGNAAGYDRLQLDLTQADFDDDWAHWAFTKNSTTGEMKVYRNGQVLVSSTSATKPFDTAFAEFTLGSETNGSNDYPGWIDEVRIHNRVLSAEEIEALVYSEGSTDLERWVDSYVDESVQDDPEKGGVAGDVSGNGIPNGFYYAFGLGDPNQAEVSEVDVATKSLGLPITYWTAEGNYGMSYVRPKDTTSVTLTPMMSSDLQTWVPYTDATMAGQLLESSNEDVDTDYEMWHLEFQQQSTPQFFRFEVNSTN